MLQEAQFKARSLSVTFVHADMRDFDLRRRFPLVILSCNSLAHLTTQNELRAGLQSVTRHLAPDGLFAFDIVSPDLRVLAQSQSECVRLDLGPNPSSAIPVEEIGSYDRVQQIRAARWRVLHQDTAAEIAPLNLRLFFPQEVPLLMETAGLQLIERYGDFARNPFSNDSLNQVCIARAAYPG